MSAFVIMVPAVMGGPALTAAAAVAGAALGLKMLQGAAAESETGLRAENGVDVNVPNSHALADSVDDGDFLVLKGNGYTVRFVKSGRGDCRMVVTGEGKSKAELKTLGTELINKVAQHGERGSRRRRYHSSDRSQMELRRRG